MSYCSKTIAPFFVLFLMLSSNVLGMHDGPDPLAAWHFKSEYAKENVLTARLGPDGKFKVLPRFIKDSTGEYAYLNGRGTECVIAADHKTVAEYLPKKDMTISAWVAIEAPEQYGSIIGVLQDNGGDETGWCLGYDKSNFYFALSTKGADDGDGLMTYLTGETKFELGKLYHVVAVYDGAEMQLYVNGKLDAKSSAQSKEILYPKSAPFVIGAYRDANEFFPMRGRLKEISIFDQAAKGKWVSEEFGHHSELAQLPPVSSKSEERFVVKPYLQYGTQNSMTVCWRSATAGKGRVHWGETVLCKNTIESPDEKEIQQIVIKDLQPETQYFYWVESSDKEGKSIESEPSTFQTACKKETAFAFAVISDTQDNPKVSGQIAKLAWEHRPNFLLHPGDLVGQGKLNSDWIEEFFSSMNPLISRVPMYPVLGNHEQNAKNYFDYMALPNPEYYYQFSYGNTDFFVVDTNRKVEPGSEQYVWLDGALSKSKATWKIVCHHHPPYSSDENDYGDLWKTNKSSRGDTRARKLVPLYEKYNVDIVWNGHIHSYERTWPVRENKTVNQNGTIYMITGGGGGSLETPGPFRPFFQNNVRRGHHYSMVYINGTTLELKSFSLENDLFDTLKIEKKR